MRLIRSVAPLTVATVLAAPLAAQQTQPQPPPPQIVTTGEGEAQVTPDRARINISVETRARTAAAAAEENARIQQAVITRVRALGIPAERILTLGYRLEPEYQYDPQGGGRPRISGYVARNTIRADIWQMDRVARAIDAALGAGANSIGSLDFYSSREDEIRRQALTAAVRQARLDAEAMATAAGGRLGPLIEIQSGGSQFPPPMPYARGVAMDMAVSQAVETPISPGEQTFRTTVTARWQFVGG
jgi:uncharacterized protein YggE